MRFFCCFLPLSHLPLAIDEGERDVNFFGRAVSEDHLDEDLRRGAIDGVACGGEGKYAAALADKAAVVLVENVVELIAVAIAQSIAVCQRVEGLRCLALGEEAHIALGSAACRTLLVREAVAMAACCRQRQQRPNNH